MTYFSLHLQEFHIPSFILELNKLQHFIDLANLENASLGCIFDILRFRFRNLRGFTVFDHHFNTEPETSINSTLTRSKLTIF